jgi:mRNA interferase RelE/StbE
MYRLRVKRSAEADLDRLPGPIFDRINERILALKDEPRPPGVVKLRGSNDGWRIRVGDYRVVYQINDAEQMVVIVRVRHRKEVYR